MAENVEALELKAEFPLLWAMAKTYDFATRVDGCSDPVLEEVDRALRELLDARRAARLPEGAVT